jgi:hypothetical protein
VVPLDDDPAGVPGRGGCCPRPLPCRGPVERERQTRRLAGRRLRHGHDLLDSPPPVVTGVARRGALRPQRELTGAVARVFGAGNVGLQERGTSARDRLRVPFSAVLRVVEGRARQLDRAPEQDSLPVARPRLGDGPEVRAH